MSKPALTDQCMHTFNFIRQTSFYKITIIDTETDLLLRENKEKHYVKLLKNKIPLGLNVIIS